MWEEINSHDDDRSIESESSLLESMLFLIELCGKNLTKAGPEENNKGLSLYEHRIDRRYNSYSTSTSTNKSKRKQTKHIFYVEHKFFACTILKYQYIPSPLFC